MKFCHYPNSADRFARRRADREGFSFVCSSRSAAVYCQIFDIATGSGPSAQETTQTASGSGANFGNGGQLVQSGIGVGKRGKYQETGSTDLSGAKIGKGATINFGAFSTPQPIANMSGPPTPGATPAPVPVPTATTDPGTTPAAPTGIWDQIKAHWAAWSTWQKVGAGVAGVLVLWLIFHPRRP